MNITMPQFNLAVKSISLFPARQISSAMKGTVQSEQFKVRQTSWSDELIDIALLTPAQNRACRRH